jgi:hypothetical protein
MLQIAYIRENKEEVVQKSLLIDNKSIVSGIYNISDDIPISTNQIITLIAQTRILKIPKFIIHIIVNICDLLNLSFFNKESLRKLTQNYVVNNNKIKNVLNKPLPNNSIESFNLTLNQFKKLRRN